MNDWLWTLPIVGAVVGYGTNWIAIRMLFRPQKPRRFFGFRFQGLVPRRRKDLAASIAATVEQELVKPSDIQAALSDPEIIAAAETEIDKRVREFLERKADKLPAVALALLPADIEDRLRKSIVKHVMNALPEISENLGRKLAERLDVKALVVERVEGFSNDRLEEIVLGIARRELRAIELLGGVLGGVIGGVQWAVLRMLA